MKKKKLFEVSLINKTYSKVLQDGVKFYTSDTALELGFELLEVEHNFDSAEILLLNDNDRSFVTRTANKTADGFTYEIEDDIVAHYGEWKAQLKFEKDDEVYVSSPVVFRIENDLSNDRPPQLTDVNNWESLRKRANDLIAEIGDIVVNETARIEAEKQRQEKFAELEGSDWIKDRSVTPNKTTFINSGKNLFRKSERVTDKYWARVGGKATLTDNAQLDTMPTHTPVIAGETYYKNAVGHIFFTNDTDSVLSTVDSLAPAGAYIVPPNATRMYFNVYKGDVETYQIEKGDTETEYDDGGFSLSSDIKIDLSNTDLSWKQDKLIAGDGISIVGNTISSDIDISTPINNLNERIDNLSMIYGEIPKYYKVNNTGDFTVFIPISDTEYGSYNFRRDSNENYMKMRENGVYTKGGAILTSQINYGEVTNSFLSAISSNNPYALNVGTKIETNFKGYSIEIVTFVDNRGGVWNIKIDGVEYGDYSTYSDVAMESKTLTIIDNLSDTNHKMVMEFIGDDPLNAPTSQARGWLKKTVDGAWTVKTKESSNGLTSKFDITESGSNKEFAFSISENPPQGNTEWFPQHNGVGTMFVTSEGVQSFVADGQEVNLETPTDLIPFIQGKFTQICFARLSRDTSDRAKMILNYNFNDVVNQYFEMEFLQPSVIHAGYVFQLPARQDYLGQIKTEKREVVEAQETIDTVHTPFKDLDAYEYIATSNNAEKSDYYLRQKITNRSDDIITLELQHRSSQFQKLYPRFFMQKEIVAGQKVWFDGEYEIGKLQNANKIYG